MVEELSSSRGDTAAIAGRDGRRRVDEGQLVERSAPGAYSVRLCGRPIVVTKNLSLPSGTIKTCMSGEAWPLR